MCFVSLVCESKNKNASSFLLQFNLAYVYIKYVKELWANIKSIPRIGDTSLGEVVVAIIIQEELEGRKHGPVYENVCSLVQSCDDPVSNLSWPRYKTNWNTDDEKLV